MATFADLQKRLADESVRLKYVKNGYEIETSLSVI